jgi:hypothetical protein
MEPFGESWRVGMAKLDKKIMANDFRYLNYNFQIKD